MKFLIFLLFLFLTCNSSSNTTVGLEKLVQSFVETKPVKDTIRLKAKVIRIVDGDTMEVLYYELPIKIRLAHIDTPEKRGKQPFGNAAKKRLSDLCFGQTVAVVSDKTWDRSGRLVAEIYNNSNQNVNKEMVKSGLAWHFKKYSQDQSYHQLELEARNNKVGLWQDPNPIAPWDWR